MMQIVDTGLPALAQPFSWAVKAAGPGMKIEIVAYAAIA